MWRRVSVMLSLVMMAGGCANLPNVRYSQTQVDETALSARNGNNLSTETFFGKLQTLRGAPFGDAIFQRNTTIHWIIPEIDKLDLQITSREEGFTQIEYESRLSNLRELHSRHLIFAINLRLPFYGGWTQSQLLAYLQNNLVVSLENGSGNVYPPAHKVFQFAERTNPGTARNLLEVGVPIRVLFNRQIGSEAVVSQSTKSLVLKLRVEQKPPFTIGFFDEKFFQGFEWRIVRR